jgi:hypothetical protein
MAYGQPFVQQLALLPFASTSGCGFLYCPALHFFLPFFAMSAPFLQARFLSQGKESFQVILIVIDSRCPPEEYWSQRRNYYYTNKLIFFVQEYNQKYPFKSTDK